MVRVSPSEPYNYRPVCTVGLTTWFGRRSCLAVSPLFFPCLPPFNNPQKAFRPSASIIHRLPPDGPIWVVLLSALERGTEFKWKMMRLPNCRGGHIRTVGKRGQSDRMTRKYRHHFLFLFYSVATIGEHFHTLSCWRTSVSMVCWYKEN